MRGLLAQGFDHTRRGLVVFQGGDELRQCAPIHFTVALDGAHVFGGQRAHVLVAAHDHLADHPSKAHFLTVFRAENAHAMFGQRTDFRRYDHAAAAAKHLNVLTTSGLEQIHHVREIFVVPALVRADGDALRILLKCGCHYFVYGSVVAQMDDFGAHALQNAAHDVDRGVVAVKQTGCRYKTHLVYGAVVGQSFVFSGQIGHSETPELGRLTSYVYVNVNHSGLQVDAGEIGT